MSENKTECPGCKKRITEYDLVRCCMCQHSYHYACMGLSRRECQKINRCERFWSCCDEYHSKYDSLCPARNDKLHSSHQLSESDFNDHNEEKLSSLSMAFEKVKDNPDYAFMSHFLKHFEEIRENCQDRHKICMEGATGRSDTLSEKIQNLKEKNVKLNTKFETIKEVAREVGDLKDENNGLRQEIEMLNKKIDEIILTPKNSDREKNDTKEQNTSHSPKQVQEVGNDFKQMVVQKAREKGYQYIWIRHQNSILLQKNDSSPILKIRDDEDFNMI